ncbi:hypothetical protein [Ancylobacter sp. FA202]|jgi:hypothetical protein|uniref:hypothetical protein n=1 Tax=Ancylobacter sp. FA202 TaxID=1111106 RepID=UPI0003780154|nr:hypothetical protein [Ancylobacter sp. FA202]RTL99030.1 hypothetical protein EJV44_05890 [Ancylobacter aquaticus]
MTVFGTKVLKWMMRAALAVAIALPLLAVSPPAQASNSTGALIGGLVAGALVGSVVTSAVNQPKTYYYAPPPPPPPAYYPPPPPRPVYGPGYCGAPPYPPCRTPVY